jgi:hypothetical protein
MISMYECSACCYSTQRKDTFTRHLNSVVHSKKILQISHHYLDSQNNIKEKVAVSEQKVAVSEQKVAALEQKVADCNYYICKKCDKKYKVEKYLHKHESKCTGIDSLTCPKCKKTFKNKYAKYRHNTEECKKMVSIFEAENVKKIINNNQTYNTNNTNYTNSLNTNNNITNIYVNNYNNTRKDYLQTFDNFFNIVKLANNNILVRYLKCRNMNPHFPENHSIKYEGSRFRIRENNDWNLIHPKTLKNKLYNDCGSEVLGLLDLHKDEISKRLPSNDIYEHLKKKCSPINLQLSGEDKEVKDAILTALMDGTMTNNTPNKIIPKEIAEKLEILAKQ